MQFVNLKKKNRQQIFMDYFGEESKESHVGKSEQSNKGMDRFYSALISDDERGMIDDDRMNKLDDKTRLIQLHDSCERIAHADRIVNETMEELMAVTSYINDLQKIELAESEDKRKLIDTARKIDKLTRDREKFKNRKQTKMRPDHYAIMEKYESTMVEEIEKLENYELENATIRSDLNKLEGERGNLIYEKDFLYAYQRFLKMSSWVAVITFGLVYLLIGAIFLTLQINMMLPVLVTTVLSSLCIGGTYIITKRNEQKIRLNEKKMNKLIGLFNKLKIKYYNSIRLVESLHEKYCAVNAKELKHNWEKYMMEKDIISRNAKNRELLDIYHVNFIKLLKKLQLEDVYIWTQQLSSIVNPSEIVEIRKRLVERRNSLKERIEYNKRIVDKAKKEIKNVVMEKDDYRREAIHMLKHYDINF